MDALNLPPVPKRRHVPWSEKPWRIVRSDVLRAVESGKLAEFAQFDAILCDPPWGLTSGARGGFMGLAWDHGVPSARVWRALATLLRPGAPVAAFGGSRMFHRLMVAMEDGGLEMRDCISVDGYEPAEVVRRLHGQGWPKPGDVSKYIDSKFGASDIGGSFEAVRFSGYHANLKPAWEPVPLMRKPLDGTLANNALWHGVGGLNVDGCRVASLGRSSGWSRSGSNASSNQAMTGPNSARAPMPDDERGRWPANVVLTCEELLCGPGDPREIEHKPGCHVYELNRQSEHKMHAPGSASHGSRPGHVYGISRAVSGKVLVHNDPPGAAKFFYCAKVSRSERGVSAHPCMKPIALCTWLARLILPPPRADGQPRTILIPYSGSGSEMIGALGAGWDQMVGIEWDEDANNPDIRPDYWADVAEERIKKWSREFTVNLRLADKLRDVGHLTQADFRDVGIKPSEWLRDRLVEKDGDMWRGRGRLPGDGMNRRTSAFYLGL